MGKPQAAEVQNAERQAHDAASRHARLEMVMTTATQDRQRAIAIDAVITFGADLTPAEICEVFEAAIEAWPAEHHRLVMALGNRIGRIADKMEREAAL